MTLPIPTAAALLHVELGAAASEFTELSPDECMAIAAHFRSTNNTLSSTQAELELCRKALEEERERTATQEHFKEVYMKMVIAEQSAHLATRRALVDAWKLMPSSAVVKNEVWESYTAARAEVAKANQPRADAQKGGAA